MVYSYGVRRLACKLAELPNSIDERVQLVVLCSCEVF